MNRQSTLSKLHSLAGERRVYDLAQPSFVVTGTIHPIRLNQRRLRQPSHRFPLLGPARDSHPALFKR